LNGTLLLHTRKRASSTDQRRWVTYKIVAPAWDGDRVQLRYAYRLNPTRGQRIALSKAFGCARVVFNDAVAARRAAHQAGQVYPTDAELSRALTAAKRTPERAWLAEVSAVVLQQALADANTAYRPEARRASVPLA
jgi:transposase